jgi:hypothetical protein
MGKVSETITASLHHYAPAKSESYLQKEGSGSRRQHEQDGHG